MTALTHPDTAPINPLGPDPLLREAGEQLWLTENLVELAVDGYTVVPPEKVGSNTCHGPSIRSSTSRFRED